MDLVCWSLVLLSKLETLSYIYFNIRRRIRPSRGVKQTNHWTPSLLYTFFWLIFSLKSQQFLFIQVFLPVSLRELSLRSLWSSSASTAGSCFFLCLDIVLVVIDPIFSNATCNKKNMLLDYESSTYNKLFGLVIWLTVNNSSGSKSW